MGSAAKYIEDNYKFSGLAKTVTWVLLLVGLVSLVLLGLEMTGEHSAEAHHAASARFWSNLYVNSFFFFGISLASLFFMAIHYAAEVAWSTVLKRVIEAIGTYILPGVIPMLIVFVAASMHMNHIFHWMDPQVMDPASEHFDALIAHKKPFLNQTVFWGMTLLFVLGYIWYQRATRRWSLQEDEQGGLEVHKRNFNWSAAFLVFFGYSSIVVVWLWIMSIDTHWFSTLFGWYVFSGIWISFMTVLTLVVLWLKRLGHMPYVNRKHIHDLGKWMFGISFLWTYLWFSQYMLIWYANIPEEVTYYIPRMFGEYKALFFGMVFVNFVFPMILLMDSENKMNPAYLTIVGVLILCGHWCDVYMLITPAVMKSHFHFGLLEVGLALGFLAAFILIVSKALSQRNLLVKNNPYLEESLHHH